MAKKVWKDQDRSASDLAALFGDLDQNKKMIEEGLDVHMDLSDGVLQVEGEDFNVEAARDLILEIYTVIHQQGYISRAELRYLINMTNEDSEVPVQDLLTDVIVTTAKGKPIRAKTLGQKRYVDAIADSGFTFGIGPAGTGKTYLAMAMAIKAFKNKEVDRLVLTRPAVEAGESLGFLPGDLQEKIDPYLRPIYDSLYEIMGGDNYMRYREYGMIEVAPLAYMRGRTLDNSFIILDEAQNTTIAQMKMFLTRLGYGSKAVITGDISQIDLPRGKKSGLVAIQDILKGVDGISFCYFNRADVVRHPLVQKVIDAFEKFEANEKKGKKGKGKNQPGPRKNQG